VADQEITARHDEQKLDVDVTIDPGPKLRFGPLTVEGKSKVRRERIYEIAALPEGEVFSPKELEDAAARLRRTGAFRSVAVIEEEVASDGESMPITASVVDNKPRRLGFGAEFATIEGLTLNAFWLHRNLFGGAERLRIDGFYGGIGGDNGGIDYGINFRFDRPATFNADTGFYAKLQLEHIDDPNVESDTAAVEMGAEWRRSDEQTYRLGAGLRHSDTKDALDDTKYTTFYIPAGLTFDYRNNELDARRGYYLNYDTAPFVALSGIDNGFYNKFDLRGYRSFNVGNARATTLALRLQLGSLAGPSLEDSPSDFLFYSGGGGTVRGHDYQSLGVQVGSDDDDIVGGRSFLGISTEVRFRTQGALGFVGFFDAGYIGRKSFPDGSGEWHTGAGLGVRYATPIGPIRFDFAVPTSNNNGDNNFQLYFGIGQAF
jgi:translocation and assembly module TamA